MIDLLITLSNDEKNFIEAQVASGDYETSSEYINALIFREMDRDALREKLLDGQRSGFGTVADEAYFARLRQRVQDGAALQRQVDQGLSS